MNQVSFHYLSSNTPKNYDLQTPKYSGNVRSSS